MSTRRSGLGKGLGALLPNEVVGEQGATLLQIPLSQIRANPLQPRAHFDEEALSSLTDSVKEVGVLQPILVRGVSETEFELIAGERRWRAAKRAGLPTIPAVVQSADDATSLEHALVENLHREDLNALEEAAAFQQLIEDFELTHEQVAQRVGKSRAAVTNSLRLFQLPPSVQKLLATGVISAGHAKALLGTPNRAFQEELANRVVSEGLSVRAVEDEVKIKEGGTPSAPAQPRAAKETTPVEDLGNRMRPPGLLELEELLAQHLDTRVKVEMGTKKGRVVLDFADLEDLERIYRLMTNPDV
ncbi:MAG TPA: ParB/RepB/Spo0J family partition protein [Acidimicrobiales bacterium]|nr:ParB/RepB/Spo0J family partition protein [Acidimicrobiales bacterium]